jgi:hypothetical protein
VAGQACQAHTFAQLPVKSCKIELENVLTQIQYEGGSAMTDQKLRELLEQLHAELARTESVDEKGREMLAHLSADIQKLLEPSGTSQSSLLAQVQDAIDHFEVEHPAITAALSQMLNTLNNAGI